MDDHPFTCERCGAPALVFIGHDPDHGNVIRDFCLDCADDFDAERRRRGRGLHGPALVICLGLTLLLLSVFADALAIGKSGGLGWKQHAGVIIGGCLTLMGAVLRVPTVLLMGIEVAGLSLCADRLELGLQAGFGPDQLLGSVMGALIVLVGVAASRYRRKEASGPPRRVAAAAAGSGVSGPVPSTLSASHQSIPADASPLREPSIAALPRPAAPAASPE